jgi:hypothetical protein
MRRFSYILRMGRVAEEESEAHAIAVPFVAEGDLADVDDGREHRARCRGRDRAIPFRASWRLAHAICEPSITGMRRRTSTAGSSRSGARLPSSTRSPFTMRRMPSAGPAAGAGLVNGDGARTEESLGR